MTLTLTKSPEDTPGPRAHRLPPLRVSMATLPCSGMNVLRKVLLATVPVLALAAPAPPAAAEWAGPCLPASYLPASYLPAGSAPTAIPNCHFWRGKLKFVDDGDTIDVRLPTSTGRRKTVRVRITGIQAMEQRVYTSNPRKRRG